jgi:hypothetical protein
MASLLDLLTDGIFASGALPLSVPITVTRPAPNDTPVASVGVWLLDMIPSPEEAVFQKREVRRDMAISRTDVDVIEKGTTVNAPPRDGGVAVNWTVDSVVAIEANATRVSLVPAT